MRNTAGNPRGPSEDPGGNGMGQLNKRKISPKAEVYQTLKSAEPKASQLPIQNGEKGKMVNLPGVREKIQVGHWAQWFLRPFPSLIIP